MTPFPFDPVNGPKLLIALGYELTSHPAYWKDVGGPEDGPRLVGHNSYDEWTKPLDGTRAHTIIVQSGEVVEVSIEPIFDNSPF